MKIGIVSMYPPRGQRHPKSGGVSSYTKNLINGINGNLKHDEIVIFAEKQADIKTKYTENDITIHRCWNPDVRYILQIIREMRDYKFELMHLQFEYFLYGSIASVLLFPMFLLFLRAKGISTILTMHQVIQLSKFNNKFRRDNSIRGILAIQKFGISVLTKLIIRLPDKVIVHEKHFKDILCKEYGCVYAKIIVIPHGIEEKNDIIDKVKGKEILKLSDRRIVLYFGYISRYKGLENLIDAFKSLDSNLTLIIAGGEHPRLKDNSEYKEYILNLKKRANRVSQNIIFTGFVSEDMIPVYFSAADVVILPYTLQTSSSGPLALAVTYERPFLVSEEFKYVSMSDIIFKNGAVNIANKIEKFFNDPDISNTAIIYSRNLKYDREWKKAAEKHINIYKEVVK